MLENGAKMDEHAGKGWENAEHGSKNDKNNIGKWEANWENSCEKWSQRITYRGKREQVGNMNRPDLAID